MYVLFHLLRVARRVTTNTILVCDLYYEQLLICYRIKKIRLLVKDKNADGIRPKHVKVCDATN